jgi:hypothetical protein
MLHPLDAKSRSSFTRRMCVGLQGSKKSERIDLDLCFELSCYGIRRKIQYIIWCIM